MENKITELIKKANEAYYDGDDPIMSDKEYDGLKEKLREINPSHPLLKQVGNFPQHDSWKKASHQMPMGSLNNVFNEEEFRKWASKFPPGTRFTAQPKLDGASLEIIYEEGKLQQAITRGDGIKGEDITRNVLRMGNVLQKLESESYSGSVRGEILISKDDFEDINRKLPEKEQYSNPRNAAAGICRRLDGKFSSKIMFLPYDMTYKVLEEFGVEDQEDEDLKLEVLKSLGFKKPLQVVGNTDKMVEAYTEIGKRRDQYPFNIDGVVIKVCSGKTQKEQGNVNNRPKAQIAWKFDPPGGVTTFKEETWDVGRTGVITPLAWLEPLEIDGSIISKATLHNLDEIERLGIGRGDTVMVVKSGDIIPKITRVIEHRGKPMEFPSQCPGCGGSVVREGPMLKCVNDECVRRGFHRVMNWIKATGIDELGESLIKDLFERGSLPNGISSIYELTINHIVELDGWGEKSARVILENINKTRTLSPEVFLTALGITSMSEKKAKELVSHFGDIQSILEALEDSHNFVESLAGRKGFGKTSAEKICKGLIKLKGEISSLRSYIDIKESGPKKDGVLSFCITGSMSKPKSYYKDLIEKKGWIYSSSLTKDVTFLVCNEDKGSSKTQKAKKYGTEIIDEKKLIGMLGNVQKSGIEIEETSLF